MAAPAPMATRTYAPTARSPKAKAALWAAGMAIEDEEPVLPDDDELPVEVDPAVAVAATALALEALASLVLQALAVEAAWVAAMPEKEQASAAESWPM